MEKNVIELLKEIIAFNTSNPPGNERALAQHIADTAKKMGAEAELDIIDETRANVIIHIRGKDKNAPSLMMNGHMDVVPATGEWESDPFTLSQRANKLYGRGTSDMKGAIACMLAALQKLKQENFEFQGDLYMVFVADEECDNLGTNSFLKLNKKVDYCVIGEPTELKICPAHRGVCRHKVIIEGKSCHASDPDKGINSVEKMSSFVLEIAKLNQRLKTVKHPVLPPATVAVTTIKGGEKHNIIPDYCEAVLDWRTLPSESEQVVRNELISILDRLSDNGKLFSYRIELVIYLGAGNLEPTDILVDKVKKAYADTFSEAAVVEGFPACGEQSIYIKAGIKAIFCGPGNISQAHTTDEFIEVSQIEAAVKLYKNIIKEILG